jgi:hypothetical protein
MRRMLCFMIISIALTGNAQLVYAQANSAKHEREVKERVVKYGIEQRVFITLISQEKVEAQIRDVQPDSFTVQVLSGANLSLRQLSYSDVKNIKQRKEPAFDPFFSRRTAFIIGIVTGILMIVGQAVGNE